MVHIHADRELRLDARVTRKRKESKQIWTKGIAGKRGAVVVVVVVVVVEVGVGKRGGRGRRKRGSRLKRRQEEGEYRMKRE